MTSVELSNKAIKPAHVPDSLVYEFDYNTDPDYCRDPHARAADLAANAPEGKAPRVRLRIRVSAAAEGDSLHVTLNGTDVGAATPEAPLSATPAPAWFELSPPVQDIRFGDNEVAVRFATSRALEGGSVQLDRLELIVRYAETTTKQPSSP